MIAVDAYDVGAMLRAGRRRKRMSQSELADMVGVTRQWVAGAERGAPTARLDLVLQALRCVDLLVDIVPDDSRDRTATVFGHRARD